MSLYNIRVMNSLAVTDCFTVSERHVFLSKGCRLFAFCPATVDEEHVVYCEERAQTEFRCTCS